MRMLTSTFMGIPSLDSRGSKPLSGNTPHRGYPRRKHCPQLVGFEVPGDTRGVCRSRRIAAERLPLHRNVLQFRTAASNVKVPIPRPVREQLRPAIDRIIRHSGVRQSWAIALWSERPKTPARRRLITRSRIRVSWTKRYQPNGHSQKNCTARFQISPRWPLG